MYKGHKYVTSGPSAFSVTLDAQTNIYVVSDTNWQSLNRGRSFHYVDGRHATHSPTVVHAPTAGTWWVVIEAIPGRRLHYGITPV